MPIRLVALTAAAALLAACNCGDDRPRMDGGQTMDGGDRDAGPTDAGEMDAGEMDSGTPDAGQPDAGMPDAGPMVDDAGCPLPSGIVGDRVDAGLPMGLVLWLRGDVGVATLDGGAVCRWEDISGNSRHFTPVHATLPSLDPIGVDNEPAVVFTTNSWLERADVLGLSPTQARTVAVRSLVSDTTRRFGSFMQGDRSNNWRYLELEQNTFNTAGGFVGVYLTANAYDSDLPTAPLARTHLYSVASLTPGTVLPAALYYAVDGVDRQLTRTPGGAGPSGPGNNLVWDFAGANFTSIGETRVTGFAGGAISEVLVFDHELDSSERSAVERHLKVIRVE